MNLAHTVAVSLQPTMRTALLIAAALTTAAIPFGSAQAEGPHAFFEGPKRVRGKFKSKKKDKDKGKKKGKKDKGKKGKLKGKGNGKGDSDQDHDQGSGNDPSEDTCELPNGVLNMVKGSGQRLSFTFAGKIWTRESGTSGSFFLAFHPQSPSTAIVHVSCRYNEFSNVEISNARSEFRMSGSCRQVFDDGRMQTVDVTNDVIINNSATDSVSISAVGGGLSVPPGALSFGNFQMADGSTPTS